MELKLLKRIHHVTFLQRQESPVSTLSSAAASTTETGQDPLRDACRYSTLFGIFGAACRYSALYGIYGTVYEDRYSLRQTAPSMTGQHHKVSP